MHSRCTTPPPRYWAIAPPNHPREVFKFRGIGEAQVGPERFTLSLELTAAR